MRNAAPLQVESNAVRAEKIRKAAAHDECQQSLSHRPGDAVATPYTVHAVRRYLPGEGAREWRA